MQRNQRQRNGRFVLEPPEAPKQLDVTSVGTRWLEFRWDSVKAHVTHYVLQMNINYGPEWSNYTVGGSVCDTKISYLRPATVYTARVVAVNDFGSSNPSPNNTATTLEDGKHNVLYRIFLRSSFSVSIEIYFSARCPSK